jgi:3-deoxy-D-manno-octulosonic-acid transferase
VTAAKIAHDQFPNTHHQFIPFDSWFWVKHFLNHWKPDHAFFVESELWPNLITICHQRKIPMALLNARLSDRSFCRWKCFHRTASTILNRFNECLAQSTETAERLRILGAKNVTIMANLKFGVKPLPVNSTLLAQLRTYFVNRPTWIAASTHKGEETLIIDVHKRLKKIFPTLLTIIAPRHPHRAEEIYKETQNEGLSMPLLSALKNTSLSDTLDGIIIDAIGQLGTFYTACDIVFMGGSLIPHGGQNPIEPALFGKPILYGLYMHNFREVCHILNHVGAQTVNDKEKLVTALTDLFQHPDKQEQKGNALLTAVLAQNKTQRALIERLGKAL